MSKRWLVAGALLLTVSLSARAEDPDTISVPDFAPPARPIPILTDPGQGGNSPSYFQATISPVATVRAPDATGDSLADSANEYLDFGWRLPIFSMFSVGYDTGLNSFRQDQTIWDDEEATSQITSALVNKGSLILQSGTNINLTGYIQDQLGHTNGEPGFSDGTKYGADLAWTPAKEVTTVKLDASTQQTVNFDNSMLDEDIYTTSLDQKLPYLPLTLHTAGSITDDDAPLLPADDKQATIIDASLLWKIVPSTSCTAGFQRQDAVIPAAAQLADTDTYFTQVSVQTAPAWLVTLRAAREQTDSTASGQFLSSDSDLLLTVGVTWTLGDRFNLGAGINYRTLDSQAPSSAANTPPASFSLSAGGKF